MRKTTVFFSYFFLFSSLVAGEVPLSTIIESVEEYPILTPALKDRKTAKIVLNNGLEAYLVSDPSIEQSAAAIAVEAGSWQDLTEFAGTAHFLEHMLFLGTSAYPGEAEYTKYIKDNGGAVNAFTASDRTVYMFSVNTEAFTGALDRFSHFFIDPLLAPSCINRELHAVDQEFSKNVEHDGWRTHMVFRETSALDHPIRKFSTGNAQTLSGIPQETLQAWYESHYSAHKMHLVALSALPIETMIQQVEAKFSAVPSRDLAATHSYSPLFSSDQKGHFLYIAPIRDLKTVTLIWELPREAASAENRWNAHVLSYVLSHASDGSLLELLKQKNIAESLQASLDDISKDTCLFCLEITLTEEGLSQIDTAISLSYEALSKIKQTGISLTTFQEIQTMARLRYQYQSRAEPFSWITKMAKDLMDENLATFPEKTAVPSQFNPESIMQLLQGFTPDSCLYMVVADPDKLAMTLDRQETWMQVPYKLEPVPGHKLEAWKQITPTNAIELPKANPFLPSSLDVCCTEGVALKSPMPVPVKISTASKIDGYFSADDRYLVPEAHYSFTLQSPAMDGSAKAMALTDLLSKAVEDELSSTLFFARHANLSASVSTANMGLAIEVSGYSDKAPAFTQEIFSFLRRVSSSPEKFLLYKDSLASIYANGAAELPVKQALSVAYNILLTGSPTSEEKAEALQALSWKDFSAFLHSWAEQLHIEAMLYGNMTQPLAEELLTSLAALFQDSSTYENPPKKTVLQLPGTGGPFKVIQKTPRQGNGTVLVIEQGSFSFPKKASQKILGVLLQEHFFDTLRTKQQTGYIAQSWPMEVDHQLLQLFAVQSSSHLPDDLLHRFELFLEDFCKRTSEIVSQDTFFEVRAAQITALETPPENIEEMGSHLTYLAFEQEGNFAYKTELTQALSSLTYEEFLSDVQEFLSKTNTKRLAILMEGVQLPAKPLQYAEIAKEDIVKVGTYTTTR